MTTISGDTGVDKVQSSAVISDTSIKGALNASGEAPIYACRAWVNFNGTGTVAIRASGNVSSITDNGVGDYTVNFTTAMPDVNYSIIGTAGDNTANDITSKVSVKFSTAPTTTTARLAVTNSGNSALFDFAYVMASIFR